MVHRAVACPLSQWVEPSAALSAALKSVGWRVERNAESDRGAAWPSLVPEEAYPREVILHPVDGCPAGGAAFTDGSVAASGGAAVWRPDMATAVTCTIPGATSSTECELVAIALALRAEPEEIFSDSLCALQLLRSWHRRTAHQVLGCDLRVLVRLVVGSARACFAPPPLEKVRAHDEGGIAGGVPKAVGNDRADFWAKQAARGEAPETWRAPPRRFGDAVELLDAGGVPVVNVARAFGDSWWQRARRTWMAPGSSSRLEGIFPIGLAVDWAASVGVFRRARATTDSFSHPVAPSMVKWVARVRAGCLATEDRLLRHHLGVMDAACRCCGAPVEDDEHVLSGCPATGSADWAASFLEVWSGVASGCRLEVPHPPLDWIAAHRLPLAAALVPESCLWHVRLPPPDVHRFRARLHVSPAERLAE